MSLSRTSRLLVIAMLCIVVSSVALALGIHYIAVFRIGGRVDVGSFRTIDIELDIESASGTRVLRNVTTIDIGEDMAIRFRIVDRWVSGNASLVLNGVAVLRSGSTAYRVPMPCLLAVGEPCTRVQMLIPGYDTFLPLPPGRYAVDLQLSWRARGQGRYGLVLAIEGARAPRARIEIVGTRPSSTEGWVAAPGSTRSYALLVERARIPVDSSGIGHVKAYAWVFRPGDECSNIVFRFKFTELNSGEVVSKLIAHPQRYGFYCSTQISIEASLGRYVLELEIESQGIERAVLKIPLEFYSER
ncbi:MAG TPA: hypothetical protein EYH02_05465 [Ignisphaera aggregans]|uniref:Uncharacterized protein n=1 Tax=Ignisphaera aggregans TaxID=334771 RepID=A0A832Z141_9CREN|nr:hypothetical protein [Ignisphaera aggregans]